MKKVIILLLGVLVLGLAIIAIRGERSPQTSITSTKSLDQVQNVNKYKTKTNSEGQVSVKVTPLGLSDKEDVRFNIALNTHSVALEKDLKDISVLIDDKGNEYKPISWSGETGGSPRSPREADHHLEGSLIFPELEEGAKSVKLIIKGIGADRTFLWTL